MHVSHDSFVQGWMVVGDRVILIDMITYTIVICLVLTKLEKQGNIIRTGKIIGNYKYWEWKHQGHVWFVIGFKNGYRFFLELQLY